MSTISVEASLGRAEAFSRLDDAGRRRLAGLAEPRRLAAGEVLLREGEPGDAFYLCVRGLLRVEAQDLEDRPRAVGQIEPGQILGEIGVLTREPRTATVIAETDAEVLRFEMVGVLAVLKDHPEVLAALNRLGVDRSEALLARMIE